MGCSEQYIFDINKVIKVTLARLCDILRFLLLKDDNFQITCGFYSKIIWCFSNCENNRPEQKFYCSDAHM